MTVDFVGCGQSVKINRLVRKTAVHVLGVAQRVGRLFWCGYLFLGTSAVGRRRGLVGVSSGQGSFCPGDVILGRHAALLVGVARAQATWARARPHGCTRTRGYHCTATVPQRALRPQVASSVRERRGGALRAGG